MANKVFRVESDSGKVRRASSASVSHEENLF